MTIKYEPVFGDQSLFYAYGLGDEVVAISEYFRGKPAGSTNGLHTFSQEYLDKNPDATKDAPLLAMRRVIKTPIWTRADQEAGVLPPIGAEVIYAPIDKLHRTKITEQWVIGAVLECIAHVFVKGKELAVMYDTETQTVSPLLSEAYSPIEIPEEKAARLKDEWCDSVNSKCGNMLGLIYDALLSGELKAPTNE